MGFILNLLSCVIISAQDSLLVFANRELCSVSAPLVLSQLTKSVHEVADFKFVDCQRLENLAALADHELSIFIAADELRQEMAFGDKDLVYIKIGNGIVFFACDNSKDLHAYIIDRDMLELVLQDEHDPELDIISDALGDQKVKLPRIPLPPAVTTVLVKAGIKIIFAYCYIKDLIFGKS